MTAESGLRPSLSQRAMAWFLNRSDDVNHRMYAERKRTLFNGLHGRVVEIGPGTGVNFSYYPRDIEWTGIEPNPLLHRKLKEKAAAQGMPVTLHRSLEDAGAALGKGADFVVSTLVLCSVPDLRRVLAQIRRCLKPGGTFLFIEHVVDPRNRFRRMVQRTVVYTPWRFFSDGCDPGRDIAAAIAGAGFSQVECHHYHQDGPGLVTLINRPHIYGRAVR